MKRTISILAMLASVVISSSAQTAEKKTLTLRGAEQVIASAKAEAQKLQAPGGVIAVVDDGGNLMALERLDGTFSRVRTSPSARPRPQSCLRSPHAFSKS